MPRAFDRLVRLALELVDLSGCGVIKLDSDITRKGVRSCHTRRTIQLPEHL